MAKFTVQYKLKRFYDKADIEVEAETQAEAYDLVREPDEELFDRMVDGAGCSDDIIWVQAGEQDKDG